MWLNAQKWGELRDRLTMSLNVKKSSDEIQTFRVSQCIITPCCDAYSFFFRGCNKFVRTATLMELKESDNLLQFFKENASSFNIILLDYVGDQQELIDEIVTSNF